jgi:hypothetical protein
MFEPFENFSPIVIKDVHVFNPKKQKNKKKLLILM